MGDGTDAGCDEGCKGYIQRLPRIYLYIETKILTYLRKPVSVACDLVGRLEEKVVVDNEDGNEGWQQVKLGLKLNQGHASKHSLSKQLEIFN